MKRVGYCGIKHTKPYIVMNDTNTGLVNEKTYVARP